MVHGLVYSFIAGFPARYYSQPGVSSRSSIESQKVLVEPGNGLVEGLLLGVLLNLLADIAADGESVLDAGVQVDLVGQASLLQDLLGLVAQRGREDTVGLGGSDGKGAVDGGELVLVDEAGVGDEADLDAVLVVANDVLWKKTLARPLSAVAHWCGVVVHTFAPKQ